jgi:predicted nuclease with TOPRIM domain
VTQPHTPLGPFGPIIPTGDGFDLPPGAAEDTGFDEYRWSQLIEENKRIVSVLAALKARLDDQMGRNDQTYRSQTSMAERLDRLEGRIDELSKHLQEVDSLDLPGAVVTLDERLRALEAKDAPPPKPVDEINEQIVAFLDSVPDVKLTAIAIRENLGIDAKYIHDRCKTLVRNKRIRMFVEPNRHPFYQALPKAEPAVDSPA